MGQQEQKGNSFAALWKYLRDQLSAPVGHVSFWFYLIGAIVVVGGLGVWVEVYQATQRPNAPSVLTAIYTYFPAVAAAGSFQMNLEADDMKYVRSFALGAFGLVLVAVIFQALHVFGDGVWSFVVGIVGSIAALLLWWIANGKNPSFQDAVNPKDSLGADPSTEVSGGASSIKV